MKKLLLILTLILTTISAFSQYKNYTIVAINESTLIPRYLLAENETTGTKDTIGIVITIKQAMKINTDLEILQLYRGLHAECDSTVNFLVQVVDDYKKANVLAEEQIKMSDSLLKTRSSQIDNLKQQIVICNQRISTKDSIITLKDSLLELNKKELKHRLKNKNIWIGGLAAFSAFLFLLNMGH